jgi:hypothetical protein
MLSKCANPACDTPFQYLREGKLFQFDLDAPALRASAAQAEPWVENKKPAQRIERFWLCGRCAVTMTIAYERRRGPVVVPLKHLHRAAAS